MKTDISLPDSIFAEAEALAQQLGMSRSELYTEALKAYLRRYNREQTLAKLNEVYSQESSDLDTVMATMQFISLPQENW
jgi:metal-responsive CopG/Arc/MetJ family transcriptional regulator